MLDEALEALAMASGTAVVQAAGTDAWASFRTRIARFLSRGDTQRESSELERLSRTADILERAAPAEIERIRIRHEASWQARFEMLMESLIGEERERAAAELRYLIRMAETTGFNPAGGLRIRQGDGSVGAAIIHGPAIGQYYEAPNSTTRRDSQEALAQQENNRRAVIRDAAYKQLLAAFPHNTSFDRVGWRETNNKNQSRSSRRFPLEYDPEEPAYYLAEVSMTLNKIGTFLASPAKLDELAAYVATLSFPKACNGQRNGALFSLCSATQVDDYLEAVRKCFRTYFQQCAQ